MDENGEYLPGIDDYSAAIRELLEEAVPEIPWNEEVKGPALSNETEGTIAADKVTFSGQDKEDEEGVITFMIYIVVPDQTEIRLETLSRKVRKVLNEADFMDGMWRLSSSGLPRASGAGTRARQSWNTL